MANLKELCGSIPQSIIHTATNYEVARRKVAAHRRQQKEYNARMQALDMERCIFEQCKRSRTQKRVRNSFSTEEAGRSGGGTIIATIRNNSTHIHQVCRVSANRY
jgi:hypothetical protein